MAGRRGADGSWGDRRATGRVGSRGGTSPIVSAVDAEGLDAVVAGIRHIDRLSIRCHGHAVRVPELPVVLAVAAPRAEKRTGRVKDLDAVAIEIRDVDRLAVGSHRHPDRGGKFPVGTAWVPP